jgi:hypothetical protein
MMYETADRRGAVGVKKAALTSKRQKGGPQGARMVGALEAAWTAIRAAHKDVPEVILVVASGGRQTRDGLMKFGHYAHGRWGLKAAAKGDKLPEVLVSGEGLQRSASDVFETLLHEAAHGLAAARGVKDTSRGGRYHNEKFRALAEELGLQVATMGSRGWTATSLSEETRKRWKGTIGALNKALRTFRFLDGQKKKVGSRMLLATCGCGTKIRLTQKAYDAAPITCGECEQEFELK